MSRKSQRLRERLQRSQSIAESEGDSTASGSDAAANQVGVTDLMRLIVERDEVARRDREERDRQRDLQFSKLIEVLSVSERRPPVLEHPSGAEDFHTSVEEFREEAGQEPELLAADTKDEARMSHRQSPVVGGFEGQQRWPSEEGDWLRQVEEDRWAFLEAVRENSQTLVSGQQAVQAPAGRDRREPKYRKLEDGDDMEHYLVAFERFATTYKLPKEVWAQKLAPLLTGKAQAAYACMDVERIGDYDELKKAILRRYDINEETYRQRFRSCKKAAEESYVEIGIRLKDLFTKWVQPGSKTKEEVSDIMVVEQLLDVMPPELKVWVRERKPKSLKEASEMADNYVAARKGNRIGDFATLEARQGILLDFVGVRMPKETRSQLL